MRVAVVGSRNLKISNIEMYLPPETTMMISGGAKGVDASAKVYALAKGIELVEYLPDYTRYGKGAPLKRNIEIVEQADWVVVLWDGRSRGTAHVIEQCVRLGKPHTIYIIESNEAGV